MKKLLSLSLVCAMMLSMSVSAFASEEMASAFIEHEDGTIENIPVEYSIRTLPSVYTAEGVGTRYAVTARADGSFNPSGEESLNGVSAYATLYYTKFGFDKYIDGGEGGWTTNGGTITGGRKVTFSISSSSPIGIVKNPTSNSFSYSDLNMKTTLGTGIRVLTSVNTRSSSGQTGMLQLIVNG